MNSSVGRNKNSGEQHLPNKQQYNVNYALYGSYFCKEKLLPSC